MTQADSLHSTPRKTAFKIVAGTDFVARSPDANAREEVPAPARHNRKPRGRYKDRRPIEYQDGLPIIDPAGEEDRIFRDIAEHRAAVAHYDRCVTIESDAEDNVSAAEFSHIERNTRIAFDEMMLWARSVIVRRPTTRRGLIHQARYLASQFSEDIGWDEGACETIYLPDKINDRPWVAAFLKSLAAGLRKMAGELDPAETDGAYAQRKQLLQMLYALAPERQQAALVKLRSLADGEGQ
jgi:hypothetical protein